MSFLTCLESQEEHVNSKMEDLIQQILWGIFGV